MSTLGSKPARRGRRDTEKGGEPPRVPFRLIAAGGGLGIELYEEQRFGQLRIHELRWSLPGLTFPVDLSGGVRAFRHRRGRLEHLKIGVDLEETGRWLASRLRGILGGLNAVPQVWLVPCGVGVGLSAAQGALAFELLWAPSEDSARWIVSEPRCGGFPGPALSHALHAVDTAFGKSVSRRGRILEVEAASALVLREWLPELGVRAPDARGLRFGDFVVHGECVAVTASAEQTPYALPERTARALELARLTRSADDALFAGDLDAARDSYVAALESAPRHPELCQVIAAIDLNYRERAEAALGLLVESLPATSFGITGAELLAGVGDHDGAYLAVSRQATTEPYAPLAAHWWLRLSALSTSPLARHDALDHAVAACPSSEPARLARFRLRVETSDVNGALADAEHLEAAAKGAASRHEKLVQAAQHLLAYGYVQPAGRLFERALRYLPKDGPATLGLAESLVASQRPERALVLLQRAVELSQGSEDVRSRASLTLSKLLAEHYRDLPQAIARAREVTGTDSIGIEARALEAAWRARIGDIAGATLGFARLRDCIEMSHSLDVTAASGWLVGAARHCLEAADDVHAAERHLAIALRLSPRNAEIQALYRETAAKLLKAPQQNDSKSGGTAPQQPAPGPKEVVGDDSGTGAPTSAELTEPELDGRAQFALEERAAALTAQLMVTSDAENLVPELCGVLSRLQRYEELYALLQARYEDAEPTEQVALRPHLSAALEGLIAQHAAAGRSEDAELYSQLLSAIWA